MANVKNFTVDWDDLEEVSRGYNQVKARYFELKRVASGTPSKNERQRRIFAACQTIWNADLTPVYANLTLDSEKKYYVYAHLDTTRRIALHKSAITTFAATLGLEFLPFYVGKGSGERCFDLSRSETHRKVRQRVAAFGKAPTVFKIKRGLTEIESFQYEAKLVDIFGLLTAGGYLCNLDEGVNVEMRRSLYKGAYCTLRRINVPLSVTHVNAGGISDKTRVVPAASTAHLNSLNMLWARN